MERLSSDILDIFVNPDVRKKQFWILTILNQFSRPDEMTKCRPRYSHNPGNGRYAYYLFHQALIDNHIVWIPHNYLVRNSHTYFSFILSYSKCSVKINKT